MTRLDRNAIAPAIVFLIIAIALFLKYGNSAKERPCIWVTSADGRVCLEIAE